MAGDVQVVPDVVAWHYRQIKKMQAGAVVAAEHAWADVSVNHIGESWQVAIPAVAEVLAVAQVKAAEYGAELSALSMASFGDYRPAEAFVDPYAFADYGSEGGSTVAALYGAATTAKALIGNGMPATDAMTAAGGYLSRLVQTMVADAGRQATAVDMMARPSMGYVRMLAPPSCDRCIIQAGKVFRWNAGFKRHSGCDCVHVPMAEKRLKAAEREGYVSDPYAAFRAMSEAEQAKAFGEGNAAAIREGADISQVVNAQRGMKTPGAAMTSEGMTKRGHAYAVLDGRTHGRRLTPEAIMRLNGSNRAAARADLVKYGYLLPGGQNPVGALRGQKFGYGQLGHGGKYPAARARIERQVRFGREAGDRWTMTAAERRLHDATTRWETVQRGENPFASPAFRGRSYGGPGAPLTPEVAAMVERDYRRWLATGGEVHT